MITIALTQTQVDRVVAGDAFLSLNPDQIAAVRAQAPTAPPTQTGVTVPPEIAGRSLIRVALPWKNGAPRIIADLSDANAWALTFTPAGPYVTARFAGGEWQSQPCFRMVTLIRHRDGAVVARVGPAQTPSLILIPGVPAPRSGRFQCEVGEPHTLFVWNTNTPDGGGRMFMELYFQ